MMSHRCMLLALVAGALLMSHLPVASAAGRGDKIRAFDADNDGTLDLAEMKTRGSAVFSKLDRDHDGTLDKRELGRRLTAGELAVADRDHDGTLMRDEYLAVVEQRFRAANPDRDGTLDRKELDSRAGRAVLRLVR